MEAHHPDEVAFPGAALESDSHRKYRVCLSFRFADVLILLTSEWCHVNDVTLARPGAILEQYSRCLRPAYGRDQFLHVELFGVVRLAHSGRKYPLGCASVTCTTSLTNDESPGTARRFSLSGQSPINAYTGHYRYDAEARRRRGQIEFNFVPVAAVPEPSPAMPKPTEPTGVAAQVIQVKPYRQRTGDRRFKQRVKRARGNRCESCGRTLPAEALHVHHILVTSMYPQYARDKRNVLILCQGCHSSFTDGEQQGASVRAYFYSTLPTAVRARHCSFLESTGIASPALLNAFRYGDPSYWNERVIRDLTR